MGILKSLFTLGKSFISQAEESIEETQGVRMLEQHIRDAKAELDKAGKSRVDLLARVKLSHDKLKDLRERKASLEARALEALSKNVNVDSIGQRNSYVKTWGCGGFLNETNIYSRGKSLCF
ncbi:hypothetical protein CP957_24480 [Escherichia coli]|nr:hypothetical protein CRT55_26355 [Escherichia coli]AUL88231.1 hypothetical protein CR916_02155 [Escherichia coli]AUM24467.1 hypothetical protein CP957_24480 [Escherichia coli]